MCRTLSFAFFNGASQFERSTNQETLSFLRAFFCTLVILAAVSTADINMAAGTKVADSSLTAVTPLVEVQLALRSSRGATIAAGELTSLIVALTNHGALPALLPLTQSQHWTVRGGLEMVRTVLAAQPAPDTVVTLKSGKTQN